MRLSREALPKVIAGGVTALLAPILWLLLGSGGGEGDQKAEAVEEMYGARVDVEKVAQQEFDDGPVDELIARIEAATEADFPNLVPVPQVPSYGPEGVTRVVEALERKQLEYPTSRLLEIQAQVFHEAIDHLIPIDRPGRSLAILRQRAITAGGIERFAALAKKLFDHRRLARWLAERDPTAPAWILESAAIIGDPDIAVDWAPVLLWEEGPSAPSLELSAEWARPLAYLTGATGDPRLQEELDRYLDRATLARRPGATENEVRRIAAWITAVDHLAEIEVALADEPTRASEIDALLGKVEGVVLALGAVLRKNTDRKEAWLTARLERRARLDLARAQLAAARLRERQTALPPSGTLATRARKLLRVGTTALELDDRVELDHVIQLLERTRSHFGTRLLRAGLKRQQLGDGRDIVTLVEADQALPAAERVLYPSEAEGWRRFAAEGRFATFIDLPARRFESGKTWAELGDEGRTWLDRTLEILRSELHQRRDLAYLTFLEARVALGEGRTAGYEDRLLALLDEGPPPGLSRAEVGGLLVLIEERALQLAGAEGLRSTILETLRPLEKISANDSLITETARVLRFRSQLDHEPLGAIGEGEIGNWLRQLITLVTAEQGLDFDLGWERLRLQEQVFRRAIEHAERDDRALARIGFDHSRELTGESLSLWVAEANLERDLAIDKQDSDPEASAEHWINAAKFFARTARTDPKQRALLIDAARGFIAAGELDLAREIVLEASDSFSHGRGDDSQRWDAVVLGIQIERRLGRAQLVIDGTRRAIEDLDASTPVREILLLDQAWGYEELGDDATAIETLEEVRRSLGGSSPYWQKAVLERARLITKSIDGGESIESRQTLARVRDAWGEAASWVSVSEGSADLAVAALLAAEYSLELQEPERARGYLERLQAAEDEFFASNPRIGEVERWNESSERALYVLGELHEKTGRPNLARETFERAIERYSRSPRVPLGYLKLGSLAEERGDRNEAIALYRRGLRKAEAVGPDLARQPYFDVRRKLETRIARLVAAGGS